MSKKKTFLQNWEDVGVEIGKLGKLMATRKFIVGKIDELIAQVKTEKEKELNEVEMKIKQLLLNIEEYTEEHIDEVRTDERKHMTFSTGVIKTRLETDYNYPADKFIVKKLDELGLVDLIKITKKPDKRAIKDEAECNSALLSKLGIKKEEYIAVDVEPLF